ncbi:hypothetical protein B0T24DRAFT_634604 [Lasiosphaeria ovina]|uniref:Uncharacterized protein n=1 Tax=Lasiosphaeria ovina TaxID=92902 RepID=A0AAE0JZ64_9PEZI|nr:hypothetical protein B0T24DRAFT_634604 [Lasiosphaeria ovina]
MAIRRHMFGHFASALCQLTWRWILLSLATGFSRTGILLRRLPFWRLKEAVRYCLLLLPNPNNSRPDTLHRPKPPEQG